VTVIRDEQQKVFFFAKQGENYIPLRFKRSEQQRASALNWFDLEG
jgi:hypothetical protein